MLPTNGLIFLTTHPLIALLEAKRTVSGEGDLPGGYKKAQCGASVIVVVERSAVVRLKVDGPGYYERTDNRTGYRPSELRYAFTTSVPIPPHAISFIEDSCYNQCKNLVDDIDNMLTGSRYTFGYALKVDFVRGRVFRT